MVSKILTRATLVVAQNKKDYVRVVGRGALSKSKQYFPPASLSGNCINVSATGLESIRTQDYVA